MLTNQAFYFAILAVLALIWILLGLYPMLITLAVFTLLCSWLRVRSRRRRVWRGDGYTVRIQHDFREMAWVHYEEAGRTLSLRPEWTVASAKKTELVIALSENIYFPPDYGNPLPEPRILEIQTRISEGLQKMNISHAFVRLGWTGVT